MKNGTNIHEKNPNETSAAGGFLFGKYLNQNFKCKVIDILYYFN